jgi:putative flavoprotein involved in K+ transport
MSAERLPKHVEVVIVGGGQAGIAMSEHLSTAGISHVVLERGRIAERWRSERWDSLVANGPAWHDRFPGLEFTQSAPDEFPGKEEIADYLVAYASKIDAPIRCGVTVNDVRRGAQGFDVEAVVDGVPTSISADVVVAATGAFQTPVMPSLIPSSTPVRQLHANNYKNPNDLPDGGVLVVGSGSSGAQIADELCGAGRKVFLSVGSHGRPPRSYRNRDFVWWLGVLNKWDAETSGTSTHTTIAVSGADGGRTVDFRRLAHEGVTLVGTTSSFADSIVGFSGDLVANVAAGDADYLAVLAEADAYVETHRLDLPLEPSAHVLGPDPDCLVNPVVSIDLARERVGTIIWATGYARDFSWIKTAAVDANGQPVHRRGISAEPGIYFLGLPWQTRRGSSFIWGVWYDAKYIADHIAKQRAYVAYRPSARGW